MYVYINEEKNTINIKNINIAKLLVRIKTMYNEKNLGKLFDKRYSQKDLLLYQMRIIRSEQKIKIKELYCHSFFALELMVLFEGLYSKYNETSYKKIAEEIGRDTWVGKKKLWENYDVNTSRIDKEIKYQLKPYQLEFVKKYKTLKENNSLEGYMLSFDQGLGKTLTSIALSELLEKEQIIIVCPNSLRENWYDEIHNYFYKYEKGKKFDQEVYALGVKNSKYNKTKNKYIIINMESIPKIYQYIKKDKDTMIIVDESHNFRNLNSKRVQDLIKIKELSNCKDTLLMSGTPIKALPNEIVPALLLIDPYFDEAAAKAYTKMFNVNGLSSSNMVKNRFSRFIYRKTKKEVLELPEKIESELLLDVKDTDKYSIVNVKAEMAKRIDEIADAESPNFEGYRRQYLELLEKYKQWCPVAEHEFYIKYVKDMFNTSQGYGKNLESYHELDAVELDKFTSKYIKNKLSGQELKDFRDIEIKTLDLRRQCRGKAIGEILPPRRAEMFINMWKENEKLMLNKISGNDKKTIIFSSSRMFIDFLDKRLKDIKVPHVTIVGGTSSRMDKIKEWKNNDNMDILLATTQTLSTGVTLTESNQMFFFGTPWRSADYDQACDRIHRIGQNTPVNIYRVLLNTREPNLSNRMNSILDWSSDMFNEFIGYQESGDNMDINTQILMETLELERSYNNCIFESFLNEGVINSSLAALKRVVDHILSAIKNTWNGLITKVRNLLSKSKPGDPKRGKLEKVNNLDDEVRRIEKTASQAFKKTAYTKEQINELMGINKRNADRLDELMKRANEIMKNGKIKG